jgi:hypothetical protein
MNNYIVGIADLYKNEILMTKVEAPSALEAAKKALFGEGEVPKDIHNQLSTLEKIKQFAYDTEILISTPYQLP